MKFLLYDLIFVIDNMLAVVLLLALEYPCWSKAPTQNHSSEQIWARNIYSMNTRSQLCQLGLRATLAISLTFASRHLSGISAGQGHTTNLRVLSTWLTNAYITLDDHDTQIPKENCILYNLHVAYGISKKSLLEANNKVELVFLFFI